MAVVKKTHGPYVELNAWRDIMKMHVNQTNVKYFILSFF